MCKLERSDINKFFLCLVILLIMFIRVQKWIIKPSKHYETSFSSLLKPNEFSFSQNLNDIVFWIISEIWLGALL